MLVGINNHFGYAFTAFRPGEGRAHGGEAIFEHGQVEASRRDLGRMARRGRAERTVDLIRHERSILASRGYEDPLSTQGIPSTFIQPSCAGRRPVALRRLKEGTIEIGSPPVWVTEVRSNHG